MKTTRQFGRQWKAETSRLYFYGKDMHFNANVTISLPRKTRRMILLNLFRAFKEHVREVQLDTILHDDGPLSTYISAFSRGTVGNDTQRTDTDRQMLGVYLRTLRTKRELSQQEVATILGVHRAYWSKIEHGKRVMSEELCEKVKDWSGEQQPELENFLQIEPMPLSSFH